MPEQKFINTLSLLFPKSGKTGNPPSPESLLFFVEMMQSAPVGLLAMDTKGQIVLFNERAKINLDIPPQENSWLDRSVFELEDYGGQFHQFVHDFQEGNKEPFDFLELEVLGKHLTMRGWLGTGGMMIALNDVTRFKEMEASSLRANIQGQENERSRLAKEIHDGIGPLLSTLKLYLESLGPDIMKCSDETQHRYESMSKLLNMLTRETRNISRALMPIAVEEFGLVAALEDMIDKVSESAKLTVHFYNSGLITRLNHENELGLYRIVQELLNNTIKYAKAHSVNIQLIRHSESIVLTYEDDGKGFNFDGVFPSGGYGLRDIQGRVKSLGGSFTFDATSGRGVVATVEIPV